MRLRSEIQKKEHSRENLNQRKGKILQKYKAGTKISPRVLFYVTIECQKIQQLRFELLF